jgi:uncharacterized protein (TIGR03067 family)
MILAVAAGLLLAADAKDDAVQKEFKLFEGTWKVASLEIDGAKQAEDVYKEWKLVCKGENFTFDDGNMASKGVFKIDPSKKPKTLDIIFKEGGNQGMTMLGLYEIDGETFRACFKPGSETRPTEFTAKQGSGQILETLKKEKK